jgi:protein SCO1/2
MIRKTNLLRLTIGVFLGATLAGFLLPRLFPSPFHGTLLQAPEPASAFTLTTHHGQPVSLDRFHGQLVVVFFGYTHCPDNCPATLATLAQALQLLGEDAESVQVLFISVDPARDTTARLTTYLNPFHPNFLGLTGTAEEITQVAAQYGIYFERQPGKSEQTYWVDHSTGFGSRL